MKITKICDNCVFRKVSKIRRTSELTKTFKEFHRESYNLV